MEFTSSAYGPLATKEQYPKSSIQNCLLGNERLRMTGTYVSVSEFYAVATAAIQPTLAFASTMTDHNIL